MDDRLQALEEIARQAGDVVMEIYAAGTAISYKDDASPVTAADMQAERIILQALSDLTPDIPIVAEEAYARGDVPPLSEQFWLVDPLDGTKEFIHRNGEFTINIALINKHEPVLGCVFAPALGRLFVGGQGVGAWMKEEAGWQAIHARRPPPSGLTVVASRSHGDIAALHDFLDGRVIERTVNVGSSLKLCLLATGEADLYPRLGRTMEWDIAAGHAILLAAGGTVKTLDGSVLHYGKPGFANPHFIAEGLVG